VIRMSEESAEFEKEEEPEPLFTKKGISDYIDKVYEHRGRYNFLDWHMIDGLLIKSDITPSIETKVTLGILSILIVLLGLFFFICALPVRLFVDIKLMFRDFMEELEKK